MNADERTPGQQGYGQQSPQQSQDPNNTAQQHERSTGQQPDKQPADQQPQGQDGSMSTGQASYGNSGETDTLSQNSSSLGQESDIGQSGDQSPQNGGNGLFSGSGDLGSTDTKPDADTQDFADQGQGAMNEDLMGSDEDGGTTDIEVERSQGRESDVEGSSF